MFTGLVQGMGIVREQTHEPGGQRLLIGNTPLTTQVQIGDSIAVNGVCLTVVDRADSGLAFQVGPETLARTTLGRLQVGDRVNLEPALRLGDPLGGHWVSGHVDTVGTIVDVAVSGEWRILEIAFPQEYADYLVPQGSIAVDGVSLTVVSCSQDRVRIMLIPHTQVVTTLGHKTRGDSVNLEFDILAKYLCRLVRRYWPAFGSTNPS
jgi:riboflavin synthase